MMMRVRRMRLIMYKIKYSIIDVAASEGRMSPTIEDLKAGSDM
jgi:hypothetical protein